MTTSLVKTTLFSKVSSKEKEIGLVVLMSILIALSAPFTFHLPFTPVPIALQPHVILAMATLLGPRRTSFAVIAFLLQGLAGLPVFAGGSVGVFAFIGPRAGYLVGYVFAAWAAGMMMERSTLSPSIKTFVSMLTGNLVIYAFGLPWLSQFTGWQGAFLLGFLPFVGGDLLKTCFFNALLKKKAISA